MKRADFAAEPGSRDARRLTEQIAHASATSGITSRKRAGSASAVSLSPRLSKGMNPVVNRLSSEPDLSAFRATIGP